MRQKLLPCPFCWSSASLETGVTADVGGEEIQYVTCVDCSAQAAPHDWQTRPETASHSQQAMTDAEIEQWIEACNHDAARETLRHYLALRSPSPAPNGVGREQQLADALRNLLGCYDTPLSRRRFPPDEFMNEALTIARNLLSSSPINGEVSPLWISPSELRRIMDASKHEPGTVYRSDEAAGLHSLDDEPPIPLYPSPHPREGVR